MVNPNTPQPPLRTLAALLSAKEQICARASDFGGLFEIRMFNRQVAQAQADVGSLHTESSQIVQKHSVVNECLHDAMADGVITPAEARRLQRNVTNLGSTANLHNAHLRRLV